VEVGWQRWGWGNPGEGLGREQGRNEIRGDWNGDILIWQRGRM